MGVVGFLWFFSVLVTLAGKLVWAFFFELICGIFRFREGVVLYLGVVWGLG